MGIESDPCAARPASRGISQKQPRVALRGKKRPEQDHPAPAFFIPRTGQDHPPIALAVSSSARSTSTPIASAAGIATLETYREDALFERAADLAPYWEDAVHSLRDARHVIDVRNIGLIAGIELEPIAGAPTKRAFSAFLRAYDKGIMIRTTGDIIAMSPPLIIEKAHIDQLVNTLREVLAEID